MFTAKRFTAASVMTLLLSGSAHAALTAEEVWAGWQANASIVELNLVAESTRKEGKTLTLTGVTIRPTVGSEAEAVGSVAQIAMTEKPDGTVTVALAPELSFTTNEDATSGSLKVTHQDFGLTVREASGAITYDFGGKSLSVTGNFDWMADMFDGSGQQPASTDLRYSFVNPRGSYSDTPGANRSFRLNLLSDGADFNLDQVNPILGQNSKQSGQTDTMDFAFEVTLPSTFDMTRIEEPSAIGAALRDGFSFRMTGNQGASTQKISDSSDLLTYTADVTTAPSIFGILMDRNGFDINLSAGSFAGDITSPDLPFPKLTLQGDSMAMAIQMPLFGDTAQDFRYMVQLGNLVANEDAWSMIDPTKVLPRDPASLSFDIKGKVIFDLIAMMEAEEQGRTPPEPRFDSVDIVDFRMAGAGAAVSGKGAFVIDNATPTPVPSGTSEFTLTGGNGFINALITMGLLTQEDATGARMAMAMFMEPGEGDDVLTSKVEARPDGSVYVNGQRMQ
jgi:hypothetical protein